MHQMKHSLLAIATLLTITTGCGPSGPETPAVTPVSGTATLNGEPLGGAVIAFSPVSGGRGASAITNDDGTFEATSFSKGDGLVPGQYGITVTKYPQGPESYGAAGDMESDEYTGEDVTPDDPENELPAKYESAETSGLTVNVEAGSPISDFNIALEE